MQHFNSSEAPGDVPSSPVIKTPVPSNARGAGSIPGRELRFHTLLTVQPEKRKETTCKKAIADRVD